MSTPLPGSASPIRSRAIPARPVHGGLREAEACTLGLDPSEVLDFSASVNPLGPSPRVRDTLARLDPSAYPDPDCAALREALARLHGVPASRILVGNGSTELIHLTPRALGRPGDYAVVLTPTFGEYEAACRFTGLEVVEVRASQERDFWWDMDEACHVFAEEAPALVFLCNPNNPTGVYLDRRAVRRLLDEAPDATLVLDEAYAPFVETPWPCLDMVENGRVVVLRSMTKDGALAGLRLGYAVAREDVIERLRALQPSWSVNAAAQAAGLAALTDVEHLARARAEVRRAIAYLREALRDMGLYVAPSLANFVLTEVGDAPAVRLALLRRNLCVRDCTSFGLPTFIRIGARRLPDCQRLVTALRDALGRE
ncbi:MAG: histidinol-phosphate aminotransferase family protein [Chloroflexi bacterium]|nr:histidinol-phosphate aminotransferase family protein [Chloroflexota bacterium]